MVGVGMSFCPKVSIISPGPGCKVMAFGISIDPVDESEAFPMEYPEELSPPDGVGTDPAPLEKLLARLPANICTRPVY